MPYLLTTSLIQLLFLHTAYSYIEINVIDSCGKVYNMEIIEEARFIFNGEGSLDDCTIELKNSNRKPLCINAETLKLSCYSEVKYLRHFSHDIFTEKSFTCKHIPYDTWCDEADTIFAKLYLFRETDRVVLHIYYEKTSLPVYVIVLAVVIPVAVLIIVCIVYSNYKSHHQHMQERTGTRNVTAIQPSAVPHQNYPVGTHTPVRSRTQRSSRIKNTNIPLLHVSNMTTNPGQYGTQPRQNVSHFQPTQETGYDIGFQSVSQQVQASAMPPTTPSASNDQPQLLTSGTATITAIQPLSVPHQTYPLRTHAASAVRPRAQRPSPSQNTSYMTMNSDQYGTQRVSQFQPTQETNIGPRFPSVSPQVQASTMPTTGAKNYQPQPVPSGPPPSYAEAIDSTYHERMEEYKTDWDSKR